MTYRSVLFLELIMVITEEFSFPIITPTGNDRLVHLTALPPLWTTGNRSSYLSSAAQLHRCTTSKRSKLFTRSFSHVESQVMFMKAAQQAQVEAEEEKMDVLWEDFNNNDHHHHLHKAAAVAAQSSSSNSSSPTDCSSPVERELVGGGSSSSASSSDPPQVITTTHPKKSEVKAAEGSGGFRSEPEGRTSSNSLTMVMVIPANKKKKTTKTTAKKKKNKRKLILLQESVVKTMKKLFRLKNIATFKKDY